MGRMVSSKKLFLSGMVLFVLFGFSIIILVNAEPSWLVWSRTYGGAHDEGKLRTVHLVVTSDGGYALAGNTYSFDYGYADFWLVKIDADGNMMWNRTYGIENDDHPYALVQTSDGGFAIAGETRCQGAGGYDFWLVKTDGSGNMMWNQTYGGSHYEDAYALVETSDGGYAIAGDTNSFGAGGYDFWLVKIDADGNMMWNQTYGRGERDIAYSLIETSDGGYALAGNTVSFGVGNNGFWLVKTNKYGNEEWNQTYGGNSAYSLIETVDGGYALAGYKESFGAGEADFYLVKINESGNMMWNRTYGGTNSERAYTLVETSDGGYAIAGETYSFGAGEADFWLVKTDGSGNIQWSRTYGGENDDSANSLIQTSDGEYALAGNTASFGAGSLDFWLVKTNEQGVPEFPSWIILPLLLVVTLFAITIRKKVCDSLLKQRVL